MDVTAEKARVDQLVGLTVDEFPETLYVVAAGNRGADIDAPGKAVYPCSNDAPNIICVGMTDTEDRPVCWGNVGKTSVDLFAPGLNVTSTVRGSVRYLPFSGTSQATPLVAAAAALLESSDAMYFDASILKEALLEYGDFFEGLDAVSVSGMRLNAARPLLGLGARPRQRSAGRRVGVVRLRP